ncbi:peptidase M23 [Endomicrobiia bacterium]|nr:peptidase M23 [Endomicrobiia bacterium]
MLRVVDSKKILFLISLLFCNFAYASVHAEDTQLKSKQLLDVKKTIRAKEKEKAKLLLREKIFKQELKSINNNIEKTEEKLKKCALDIKTVQGNLEKSSKIYNSAFLRSSDLDNVMLGEIKLFNKMTFMFSYEQNPFEYKMRRRSLEYKKECFEKAKKEAAASALDIKVWEKSKKDLLNLQKREDKLIERHKSMMKEKNELLKTTLGKRLAMEQEIKALNDSAKALQSLIDKIDMKNRRKQATGLHVPLSKAKRKKSLPWPVDGKIIMNFGRNKHPELDTYVISNGIKIDVLDSSRVKSIDSGTVVFTGKFRSYGKIVVIDHKNSIFSVYGLLDSILVKEDQKISKGDVIANIGEGKKNNCLYFEIRQNNVPDNPILWLQQK